MSWMKTTIYWLLAILVVVPVITMKPTPQWRPIYHFTPPHNWMNDPNGLLYVNGTYHMYYQYNPSGNVWGNMSWGHTISTDLLHWTHLPVAMWWKEKDGEIIQIFSGSAVWDKKNSSGLGVPGGHGPIVAVYTADHSLRLQNQYVSYSNDGGLTYTDYERNPVIDLGLQHFRDPNVIELGTEEQSEWLMTLVVALMRKVQFYKSTNLKEWTLIGEFQEPSDQQQQHQSSVRPGHQIEPQLQWECPSLTRHLVDGDESNEKWLLIISHGAVGGIGYGMKYFIGRYDRGTFINDDTPDIHLLVDYGSRYYAAIPYNNLPYNQNPIMIGWVMPLENVSTYPWRGHMSIPREIKLKTNKAGSVRLYQQPASVLYQVLENLPMGKRLVRNDLVINADRRIGLERDLTDGNAWWMQVELELGTARVIGLDLCNGTAYVEYNKEKKVLSVGDINMMVEPTRDNMLKMEILFDKSSLEIFVNDGEHVLTTLIFPTENVSGVSIYVRGGVATVKKLKMWDMS